MCLKFNFGLLGEKLTDKEVDIVFDDCLDEENSDGEIEYDRKFRAKTDYTINELIIMVIVAFLRRMCEKDPPLQKNKKPAAAQ